MNTFIKIADTLPYIWFILIVLNVINAIFNLVKKPLPKFMTIFAYIGLMVAILDIILNVSLFIEEGTNGLVEVSDYIEPLILTLILLITSIWNIVKAKKK